MIGYSFTLGPVEYVGFRDGRPFTLADCWREVEGVGGARIWHGERLVLDRAGEQVGRRDRVRRMFAARRAVA